MAGELTGVQGLGGSLKGRLAQREHVRPTHSLGGAVVDRGGPVYGRGVEQADRRGDVEEIRPSLAEAVLKALDLGFDLGPLEKELGDDEGLGHGRACYRSRAISGR